MGYFNLKSGILLYGACARLNVQHLSAQIANMVHGHSRSSTSFIEPGTVTSSVTSLCSGVLVLCGHGLMSWLQGAALGVEVGVGMAVDVETGTEGFGSGITGAKNCGVCCVVVTQVWETCCESVTMRLMGPQAQHHCI